MEGSHGGGCGGEGISVVGCKEEERISAAQRRWRMSDAHDKRGWWLQPSRRVTEHVLQGKWRSWVTDTWWWMACGDDGGSEGFRELVMAMALVRLAERGKLVGCMVMEMCSAVVGGDAQRTRSATTGAVAADGGGGECG